MFYLPLFINNKARMHVMHLKTEALTTLHSFIVTNEAEYALASIPSERPQMICDGGSNIDLTKMRFDLSEQGSELLPEKYKNIPCYQMEIKERKDNSDNASLEHIFFKGHFDDRDFSVQATPCLKGAEYIFMVKYVYNNGRYQQTYVDAIRIITIKDREKEVCSAALDFGSEASQIFYKNSSGNLNVREAFCDVMGKDAKEREDLKKQNYYQGRADDSDVQKQLFKSIFHIHQQPGRTFLGDLPMNNGNKTYVQTLLNITDTEKKDLVLLPNLKLIELLNYDIAAKNIQFTKGKIDARISPTLTASLGSKEIQDGILRMILSNFLAVILYNKRTIDGNTYKQCLQFTLLVPNVYYQKKVAKLIDNLYEDFDTLLENHKEMFKCWRGIEIKIISESDASFFGMRRETDMTDQRNAIRLVIDAGKGTTDFSLLQQSGSDLSHYECLYRSGIPASGHLLTYAVFEAFWQFMADQGLSEQFAKNIQTAKGLNEDNKTSKQDQDAHNDSQFLDMVDLLETQKSKIHEFRDDDIEKSKQIAKSSVKSGIGDFVALLTTMNNDGVRIPNIEYYLQKKIDLLISLMEKSIFTYTDKHQLTLFDVCLTGRAFRLDMFRKSVTKALLDHQLIKHENQVLFQDGTDNLAKAACVRGALDDASYTINNKSIMLGMPSITEYVGEVTKKKKWRLCFWRKNKAIMANMDQDFYYRGLEKKNVANVIVDICGRTTKCGTSDQDAYLYFVGDKFLLKCGDTCRFIDHEPPTYFCNVDSQVCSALVEQSLFPFVINIKALQDNKIINKEDLTEQKEEAYVEQAPKESSTETKDTNTDKPINYDE